MRLDRLQVVDYNNENTYCNDNTLAIVVIEDTYVIFVTFVIYVLVVTFGQAVTRRNGLTFVIFVTTVQGR